MASIFERIEKAKPIKKEIISKATTNLEKQMKIEEYEYQRRCRESEQLAMKIHLNM